ncbi:MAG: Arc family DNA-binding protein [Longimicrobiales bacterium]|nr:Arc family DNA-binding protein [Longimicrobiales bacterium]
MADVPGRRGFPQVASGAIIDPYWIPICGEVTVPVNLSIKNVPDEWADRLRERATESHRSLQGELMAILEEAIHGPPNLSPQEALATVRNWGIETPATAADTLRAERDAR